MIDQSTLDYIKTLTESDKKSLCDRVTTALAELVDVGKFVLPYEDVSLTSQRFSAANQILEEIVDVMLVMYGMAYQLKFTDSDINSMLGYKVRQLALDWLGEKPSEFSAKPIPYEIHITVRNADFEAFVNACKKIGVNPILLDLYNGGGVFQDLQTSSKFYGTASQVYEEVHRVANFLDDEGFDVVREKIETVPWHPAAPRFVNGEASHEMPQNCYFECHIEIEIDRGSIEALRHDCRKIDLHLSRNVFKALHDGRVKMMATYRQYDGTKESFDAKREDIEWVLKERGYVLGTTLSEFSLYDTAVSHDTKWMEG